MKYYLANGQYVGTQADAKKLDPNFQTVEVPQDKEGLMGYLNSLVSYQAEIEVAPDESPPLPPEPLKPTYAAVSIALDDEWENLPVARKLHFAALAMEAARTHILGPLGKVSKLDLKT